MPVLHRDKCLFFADVEFPVRERERESALGLSKGTIFFLLSEC